MTHFFLIIAFVSFCYHACIAQESGKSTLEREKRTRPQLHLEHRKRSKPAAEEVQTLPLPQPSLQDIFNDGVNSFTQNDPQKKKSGIKNKSKGTGRESEKRTVAILQNPVNTLDQIGTFFNDAKTLMLSAAPVTEFVKKAQEIQLMLSEEFLARLALDKSPSMIEYRSAERKGDKWIFDRWPHQTWVEAVLGELFYPIQLREADNLCFELYDNETVRNSLALSSYYKNPLASYHLSKASRNFFSSQSKKQEINKQQKEINKISRALEKKLRDSSNAYFEKALKEGNPYTKALSSWYLSNRPGTAALMREAVENHQEYRLISYLGFIDKEIDVRKYYEEAEKFCDSALMGFSNLADNLAESILWALEAGERGIASGYYAAALKIEAHSQSVISQAMEELKSERLLGLKSKFRKNLTQEDVLDYLKKAAEGRMVAAYEKIAKIRLQRGESPISSAHEEQAVKELGDERTLCSLGKIYLQGNNIKEAESCFEKAGVPGYAAYFKDCGKEERKAEVLQKIANHVTNLKLLFAAGANIDSRSLK